MPLPYSSNKDDMLRTLVTPQHIGFDCLCYAQCRTECDGKPRADPQVVRALS